jgi:hypothetical protein
MLGAFGTLPEEYVLHNAFGLFLTKLKLSEALTMPNRSLLRFTLFVLLVLAAHYCRSS